MDERKDLKEETERKIRMKAMKNGKEKEEKMRKRRRILIFYLLAKYTHISRQI